MEQKGLIPKSEVTLKIEAMARELPVAGIVASPGEFSGKTLEDGFYPYIILKSNRLIYSIRTPHLDVDPDDPNSQITVSHRSLNGLVSARFSDDPVVDAGEFAIRSGMWAYINDQAGSFWGGRQNLLHAAAVFEQIYSLKPEGFTWIRDFSRLYKGTKDQHTEALGEALVQLKYPQEVKALKALRQALFSAFPDEFEVGAFNLETVGKMWSANNKGTDSSLEAAYFKILGLLSLEGVLSALHVLHSPVLDESGLHDPLVSFDYFLATTRAVLGQPTPSPRIETPVKPKRARSTSTR